MGWKCTGLGENAALVFRWQLLRPPVSHTLMFRDLWDTFSWPLPINSTSQVKKKGQTWSPWSFLAWGDIQQKQSKPQSKPHLMVYLGVWKNSLLVRHLKPWWPCCFQPGVAVWDCSFSWWVMGLGNAAQWKTLE